MPEEARAVQHLTSSQLLNVLRRRDLLRVDENLGHDECLAKFHAAGVKEVPADEVAPTARPTPAAKAASSGSSAAETRSETGVARARSEERASPDPSPVAARPFASRPALLQGFLRKASVLECLRLQSMGMLDVEVCMRAELATWPASEWVVFEHAQLTLARAGKAAPTLITAYRRDQPHVRRADEAEAAARSKARLEL